MPRPLKTLRRERLARRAAVVVAQDAIAKDMLEADLQSNIIEMAHGLRWAVYHAKDSRGQNLVGLPDLLCLRPPVSFWAELKREGRSPDVVQQAVIDLLRRCGQTVHVWRPRNWLDGTIQRVLEGKDA